MRWMYGAAVAMMAMTVACSDGSHYEDFGAPYARENNAQSDTAGEVYDEVVENEFIDAAQESVSTFSVDVDNASYTLMRRDLNDGRLPQAQGVRPEEYINFFDYAYAPPEQDHPFSINLEVAPSRFGDGMHLLQIGVKGKEVPALDMKPTNLVFLIDVSGSMQDERKLPLVKQSLYTLLENLRPSDTVGIVVYAGADRVVLEPTPVRQRAAIDAAIENLRSGGSTNAEAGIRRAYQLAAGARKESGNNRVIILTDGDFNVGLRGEELFAEIDAYRAQEISLTTMGYGLGNYNDYNMENLAKRGNGNYFYVDSIQEARRVFGTALPSTLEVIAADVKIQVEFDTQTVTKYRLLGYENRLLDKEDFDDDAKDAGEIGPGHTVTALYEVELAEAAQDQALVANVRMRYKAQYGEESLKLERAVKVANIKDTFEDGSASLRLAAAVAEFAEILRGSKHSEGAAFGEVREIVAGAVVGDEASRTELMGLIDAAAALWAP